MDLMTVQVACKTHEAQDVASFKLVRVGGGALPAFSPGAHIEVHLADQWVRSYSLCDDGANPVHYRIGVLRDAQSRGGSAHMHNQVTQGDLLRISAPKNHFPLVPAHKTLLFAGGIGLTPILCMAEHLAQKGADFALHYCARSPARAAFLQRLQTAAFASQVHLYFDSEPTAPRLNAMRLLATPEPATHLYVCGPAGFIGHITDAAHAQGWDTRHVHREHFAAPATAQGGNTAFDIEIASSAMRYTVPANRTVLEVLLANGIDVPASCEQGLCGTCSTKVISGLPEHRDTYFNAAEHARNDCFTPCCSRSRSPLLVLDL